jgi:hypothetical protein
MPNSPRIFVALAWCMIGYWFLDRGEASHAILASLGSITLASLARDRTTPGSYARRPSRTATLWYPRLEGGLPR